MKLTYLLSGAAAAALMVLPIAQPGTLPLGVAAAQAERANVSIDVFFDALGDQGEWVKHQDYRYVWVPNNVSADWAPYTHGHWANTERYGWTFVSDEPFAWAVYHYGRWGYDPEIGWFWVPGSVWAPAWVSWRRSNDVVGWAPLPPEGEGYATRVEVSSAEPPRSYWHFVPAREFLAPDLEVVVVHDESPFEETEPVGPVVIENNIVVNNVIGVDFIQQASGQQVTTTEVQVVKDPAEARQARQQGAVVAVEGQLAEPAQEAAPRKIVEAKEVKAPTAGKDIEATTTGSIKPNEQAQPDNQLKPGAAGQATGGQRTDEQSTGNAGTSGTAQPETAAPGAKPKVEGQEKAAKGTTGEENNGQAAGKPKVEGQDKAAKSTTTEEQNGQAAAKPKVQTEEKAAKGATEEQNGQAAGKAEEKAAKGTTETEQPRKLKPKKGQGAAQNEEPSGQAPAATKQGEQAQGATGEEGGTRTAQKKLKKQQGGETSGAQSEDQTGNGAMKKQGQAAEEAAPNNEQGQAAKGPRKLKQAEEQQPSQEKTGAIAKPKSKGGGEQASPEAAAPKAQGKAKGCSADEQAAGQLLRRERAF